MERGIASICCMLVHFLRRSFILISAHGSRGAHTAASWGSQSTSKRLSLPIIWSAFGWQLIGESCRWCRSRMLSRESPQSPLLSASHGWISEVSRVFCAGLVHLSTFLQKTLPKKEKNNPFSFYCVWLDHLIDLKTVHLMCGCVREIKRVRFSSLLQKETLSGEKEDLLAGLETMRSTVRQLEAKNQELQKHLASLDKDLLVERTVKEQKLKVEVLNIWLVSPICAFMLTFISYNNNRTDVFSCLNRNCHLLWRRWRSWQHSSASSSSSLSRPLKSWSSFAR